MEQQLAMTFEELHLRKDKLFNALKLSRNKGYLNVFQRMLLHLEISSILEAYNTIRLTNVRVITLNYTLPHKLDNIVTQILKDHNY